jgi:hypothetical protein
VIDQIFIKFINKRRPTVMVRLKPVNHARRNVETVFLRLSRIKICYVRSEVSYACRIHVHTVGGSIGPLGKFL